MATPALPVMRPMPPAMKAAFCSCRQTIVWILESTRALKTASFLAPGMPKTNWVLRASSARTTASAPVVPAGSVVGAVASTVRTLAEVLTGIAAVSWMGLFGIGEFVCCVPAQVGPEECLVLGQREVEVRQRLDPQP